MSRNVYGRIQTTAASSAKFKGRGRNTNTQTYLKLFDLNRQLLQLRRIKKNEIITNAESNKH